MKRKNDNKMVQTAVRLPRVLRDRLSRAGGERGLGEEIRRRLESSFEGQPDQPNPKTRGLLDAISSFADEVTEYYGDPVSDPFAADLLKACVDLLMERDRPRGDPEPHPRAESAADLLYAPKHSIETISTTIVTGWIRDRAKRFHADKEQRR
jgi:hypothetical protein